MDSPHPKRNLVVVTLPRLVMFDKITSDKRVDSRDHSVRRMVKYRGRGNEITMIRQEFGKCTRV